MVRIHPLPPTRTTVVSRWLFLFVALRGCDENSTARPQAGKKRPADGFSVRGSRIHPLPPTRTTVVSRRSFLFVASRGCDENSTARPQAGKKRPADGFSVRGSRIHPLLPRKVTDFPVAHFFFVFKPFFGIFGARSRIVDRHLSGPF